MTIKKLAKFLGIPVFAALFFIGWSLTFISEPKPKSKKILSKAAPKLKDIEATEVS